MKKLCCLLWLAICPDYLAANVYTIDDILQLAVERSPDSRIVKLQAMRGDYEAQTYLAQALPVLNFNLDYGVNDQAPSIFTFGLPTDPGGQDGMLLARDRLQFEMYSWELTLSSPLFTFGRVGSLYDMYRDQKNLVRSNANLQEDLVLQSVVQAYVRALSQLSLKNAAERTLDHAKNLLSFSELEFQGGALTQIDYLKAEADYQRAQARLEKEAAAYDSALSELKIILGLGADEKLELSDEQSTAARFFTLPDSSSALESKELQVARLQYDFAKSNRSYRAAAYWPSLSVFATARGQSYQFDLPGIESGSFSDSFDSDNISYIYGLRFSWNLFAGTGDYANHRMAIAAEQEARLQLEKKVQEEAIEKRTVTVNLEASKKIWQASRKALQASRLAFERMDSEFRNGAVSLTELLEIKKELSETEQMTIAAYGDLILAISNYKIKQGWGML